MPRVTVELSDEELAYLEAEVADGRATSKGAAAAALIREAKYRRALEELGRLAQEGIDSGDPIPITPEYWEKKRREFEARWRARRK